MANWLFKQEPSCYGYADLERDGSTVWDGVSNPLARKHLRSVQPGDRVLFYHTGDEKAIVGIMEVTSAEMTDPEGKVATVTVKPAGKLSRPVTLAEIKADEAFAEWELVRQSRLSVMPVSAALWKRIESMAKKAPESEKKPKKK